MTQVAKNRVSGKPEDRNIPELIDSLGLVTEEDHTGYSKRAQEARNRAYPRNRFVAFVCVISHPRSAPSKVFREAHCRTQRVQSRENTKHKSVNDGARSAAWPERANSTIRCRFAGSFNADVSIWRKPRSPAVAKLIQLGIEALRVTKWRASVDANLELASPWAAVAFVM